MAKTLYSSFLFPRYIVLNISSEGMEHLKYSVKGIESQSSRHRLLNKLIRREEVMKVLINDPDSKGKRKEVECVLVKELPNRLYVKLPDGNIIKRKKSRDLVQGGSK